MAGNNLQQIVLDAFNSVRSGAGSGADVSELTPAARSGTNLATALTEASRHVDELRSSNGLLSEILTANTQAVLKSSTGQSGGGGIASAASSIGSFASTVFGSGLGLIPLISSLSGLFGGGKTETPAPLLKYSSPQPLGLDLGNTSTANSGITGFLPVDRGQDGRPRLLTPAVESRANAATVAPAVTIQVQAMDSRSFMDHSNEIAQAVREAMLNMHSLNDVVNDL